jgi:hypothetical protein
MHNLISPLPFLLFMGISLAVGFTGAANKQAIESWAVVLQSVTVHSHPSSYPAIVTE